MGSLRSWASRSLLTSSSALHESLWSGKVPAAASTRNMFMFPSLSRPWCPRIANMHACRAQAAQWSRWFSAKGAGGVKGLPVEGKNARGKKEKGGGGVKVTAAEALQKWLQKHMEQDIEDIKRTPMLKPPEGWTRINIDEYVNMGEDGIIVLRKAFPDYVVDVVASTQLLETMEEDMIDPEDDENEMEQGEAAIVLVAITKLGRGKPLVIEILANEDTDYAAHPQESGLTIRRVSVGIDPNASLAQVYGPMTPLYVTYSAMWEDQLMSAGVRSGEKSEPPPTVALGERNLWLAAQQDFEADRSFAVSPDFYALKPDLQIQMHALVQDTVPENVIAFVFALLHRVQLDTHRTFINTCSEWFNK